MSTGAHGVSASPSALGRRSVFAASAARRRRWLTLAMLGAIATSARAATWQWAHPRPAGAQVTEVLWTGERFLAFGPYLVLESPDGRDWTEYGDGVFPPVCFANVLEPVTDAVVFNGRIVAVTQHTLQTSPDGVSWTDHVDFVDQWECTDFDAVAANGSTVVAVGFNCWSVGGAPMVYYSETGTDWSAALLPEPNPDPFSSEGLYDVAWDGRQFVAVGGGYPAGLVVFTSPNGREWARAPGVGGTIVAHGDRVTVIAFGSQVWTGTDGEHWSESVLPEGTGSIKDMVWVRDHFVAISSKGALTSPDGVTWSFLPLPSEAQLTRVATDGTGIVLAGRDLYFSDDSEHWTTTWVTQRLTTADLHDVAVGMWRAVAVGGGTVLTSSDGEDWAVTATVGGADHVAYGGGRWLALGAYGRALWSSDGALWHPEPGLSGPVSDLAWGAGVFVVVSNISLFVSADGVAWAPSELPAGYSILNVTWTGTEFAAIGRNYDWASAVLRSRDGRIWRSTATPGNLPCSSRVVGAAGREFVVCGGWQLYSSSDGESWTLVPTDRRIDDLDTVGGRLLATTHLDAGYGGDVWVSSDGASWERIGPVLPGIRAFAALGDRIIAVGDSGSIRYVGDAPTRTVRRRLGRP